jgi:hypothetical protein
MRTCESRSQPQIGGNQQVTQQEHDWSMRPSLNVMALSTLTRRSNSHTDKSVYRALFSATASPRQAVNGTLPHSALAGAAVLCWIQRSLPLPGRERTALGGWQYLGSPAYCQVDDDDEELFQNRHDGQDRDGAVNEAEVVVVEEDGEQGVDDPDEDKGERDDDGECEPSFAGVGGEFWDDGEGRYGQGGVGDDVEKDADLGGRLDGEGAGRRYAVCAPDYAEDEAEGDHELGGAELEHVERVGGVHVECIHAVNFVSFQLTVEGGGGFCYQRESRPSVARSRGEIPTESRMRVVSRSPDD